MASTRVTATHCNTLQITATHCNTLQITATHCNTLQITATHCNTLQTTATHCNTGSESLQLVIQYHSLTVRVLFVCLYINIFEGIAVSEWLWVILQTSSSCGFDTIQWNHSISLTRSHSPTTNEIIALLVDLTQSKDNLIDTWKNFTCQAVDGGQSVFGCALVLYIYI